MTSRTMASAYVCIRDYSKFFLTFNFKHHKKLFVEMRPDLCF